MTEKKYKVYVHTNKVNGKKYVGQTCQDNPKKRWASGHGYDGCPYLRNAIKRYGWESFESEVVVSDLTKEEADDMEIKLIADLRTTEKEFGYNVKSGGANAGGMSEEGIISWREQMCGSANPLSKTVYAFDLTGKRIGVWGSASEAASALGLNRKSMIVRLGLNHGTYHGYIIRYAETIDDYDQLPPEILHAQITRRMVNTSRMTGISVFNKNGERVGTYDSVSRASIETGLNKSTILHRVYDGHKVSDGIFPFLTSEVGMVERIDMSLIKERVYHGNSTIGVVMLDADGNLIQSFNSKTELKKHLKSSWDAIASLGDGESATIGMVTYKIPIGGDSRTISSKEVRCGAKPVAQYDIKTKTKIAEYESVEDASKSTGVGSTCISAACKGRQATAGGFCWKFLNGGED